MAATRTAAEATKADAVETLEREGCSPPRFWGNGPGDEYGWHDHAYHKVLFCLSGLIAFHTRDGDVAITPGDRLDLEPNTEHAATVGPDGCECVEASR